ncbi:MAG: type 4b pilus protein PilO2 [Alphaproteobacteria bacterium]|nr:type 4b pilus protein PilO2 [Alphaproteobacteria bacterium]
MVAGVVKVGRQTYAVGLLWQPSPSGRVAQAAREAAAQPGQQSDFYCVRAASKSVAIPQYGLAQSTQGHKSGMPTLAASLANAQPGSWAGAFRLREGTWLVVVRDDLIAPDGDIIFDNDEAARDRLLQEVSLGGVQRIYAPDGWAVPGSDPTPLPLLLQDKAECRLQPVRLPMRLIIYGAAAGAVVLLVIFLALQWQAEQERIEAEQTAAQLKAQQEALKNGPISKMVNKWEWPPADQCYERRWEKAARGTEVVEACRAMLSKVQASQLGWKRSTTICTDNKLNITWQRDKNFSGLVPTDSSVKEDLSMATQNSTGPALTPRGAEPLMRETDLSALMVHDRWPVSVIRLLDDPPIVQPPPDMKDPPPPPPPPWRKRGVKYTGKVPPWEMWRYFQDVSGLMVDKITWDGGTTWTLEITIYEKRGG